MRTRVSGIALQTDEEASMPKRRDVVAEQLHELADDLEDLWRALTRDPKTERRKERGWTLLVGVLGAGATMASRRLVAKVWPILTGEQPPTARPAQPPRPQQTSTEREDVASPSR
jgi:hypothetical protein